MKKLLSMVLVLVLALSCLSIAAAEETETYSLRGLYSGEITSLNYLTTATTNDFSLSANVIDTLVEYDK